MYAIRKPLAERMMVRTSELPTTILRALLDIENGEGAYTWGFEESTDAEALLVLRDSGRLKAYPKPNSIEEAGAHVLFETFGTELGAVTEFEAEYICPHPILGPRAGAGSVQAEAPHTIARPDWLKAYGFGVSGVCLVKLTASST